jgi:hypothetical protein
MSTFKSFKKKSGLKRTKNVSKKPWYILNDSRGHGSVTVTLLFVSFWVTTLAYIASLVHKIGDLEFREFDPAAVSAYLIPILTLYFGRRWTDSKNQVNVDEKPPEMEE